MKAADKLKKYINQELEDDRLKPGSRLPSYQELMKICQCSYATVHSAMSQLESSGLIRIEHGNGTYLAGKECPEIRLELNCDSIQPAEMRDLLDKHLAPTGMNFKIDIHHLFEKYDFDGGDKVVIMLGPQTILNERPGSDFRACEGYDELVREFRSPSDMDPGYKLPFLMTTNQIGVNTGILKQVDMGIEELSGGLDWWDDYAGRCKQAGILPASLPWDLNDLNRVQTLHGVILALNGGRTGNLDGVEPLFNTPAGYRLLQIVRDMAFYKVTSEFNNPESFFHNGAGIHFRIGPWLSCQNRSVRRPDMYVDNLALIPYSAGGRRLMPVNFSYLQAWLPPSATAETRNLIWQLIKLLLSRNFQLDLCNLTGEISSRRDIAPGEYTWNTAPMWNDFFLRDDDIAVYRLFPSRISAALSVMLDFYKFQNVEADYVLRMMDAVKAGIPGRYYPQ